MHVHAYLELDELTAVLKHQTNSGNKKAAHEEHNGNELIIYNF